MFRHASFAWYALLALSLTAVGCGKKDEAASDKSDKAEKSKGKKEKGDKDKSDDDDSKGKKSKKNKGDDDKAKGDDDDKGAAKTDDAAGGGPLSFEIEGKKVDLKYALARAEYMSPSIEVTLSTEKLGCNEYKTGDEAITVKFKIAPGTDGKFFAGKKQGTEIYWNSEKEKYKRNFAYPYEASVTVQAFKVDDDAKIKGSIAMDTKYVDFSDPDKKKTYVASGSWEAKLCSASDGYKALGGIGDPGTDPLTGKWGKETFTPKYAVAMAHKDGYTKEMYIDYIYFSEEKISCGDAWKTDNKNKRLSLHDIGGTGEKHKITGVQPASASFTVPEAGKESPKYHSFGWGGVYVQLDSLKYEDGDKIKGSLIAKTPKGNYDGEGEMNGTFEAKVCNSGF